MSKDQNSLERLADAFECIATHMPELRPERTDHPLQGETFDGIVNALNRIAAAIEECSWSGAKENQANGAAPEDA